MRDFNQLDFFIQKKRIKQVEKYVLPKTYVLDIGCGYYPQNLINLEDKINQGLGLDKDIPTEPWSNKISFIKAEIKKSIPLPGNNFDCVLMLAVLEHLDYPREIISECYRVLKPAGRLIIAIPTKLAKPVLLLLAGLRLASKEEIFDHKHYFGEKELEDILLASKFRKIHSQYYNFFLNLLFVFEKM